MLVRSKNQANVIAKERPRAVDPIAYQELFRRSRHVEGELKTMIIFLRVKWVCGSKGRDPAVARKLLKNSTPIGGITSQIIIAVVTPRMILRPLVEITLLNVASFPPLNDVTASEFLISEFRKCRILVFQTLSHQNEGLNASSGASLRSGNPPMSSTP
jgi:hypothetical protein